MTEHQQSNETEEQRDNRRWWILLLLLLLLALFGLLCSSQLAIITGFDKSISARIVSDKIAAYKLNDEALIAEFGRLDPAIIQEATQDAGVYRLTPAATGAIGTPKQVIVLLPGTSIAVKPTATNTPRPTFTHTPSGKPPTTQPLPTSTAKQGTPTSPPLASNTPTPSPTTAAVSSATPTSIPPTATGTLAAPTQTATPTSTPPTPTSTNTPAPATSTNTPVASTPTNTSVAPTATNTSVAPTATNTPVTPTPTNTPTPTPTAAGVLIEPDNSLNANPGVAIAYGHTITNTGDTADTFTLTINSSQGFSISVSPSSITLAAGANGPVTVRVTIPGTAAGGVVDITTVRATSANDPLVFDTATDTTQVNTVAGVVIQPDNSGTANPGDLVQYTHIVTNLGNSPDTIAITPRSNLGFSVSAVPNTLSLAAGGSAPVQINISVPATGYANITDTTTVSATSTNDPAIFDTAVNTTFITAPITTSFTLSAADGDQLVSLGWNAPGAPMSQTIQYAINSASWQPLTTTLGSADRYYHTPVTNGQTYYYQVKAFYGGGIIRYSTVASATPGLIAHRTTVTCTSALSVTVENSGSYTPAGCAATLNDIDAPGINPPASLREGSVTIGDPSRPGELILDYDNNGGIVDGPGYDVVFFELYNALFTPAGIGLDYTIVDVSENSSGPWTTVFAWDGVTGHVTNTNVYSYAATETEGQVIPPSILYPDPGASPPPPENTGIAIDISPYAPAGIKYRYIRLAQPAAGSSGTQVQVDAIYRLN